MAKRLCLFVFVLLAGSSLHAQALRTAGDKLTLSQPSRDGISTGCRVTVEGRASLEPGEHAWVFAARKNFADLGLVWLQGEADVDPSTQEFSMPVTLGIADDIGSSFRISVAILDEATHNRMRAKRSIFFCVPRMLNTFTPWREPTVESLLTQLADELLVQDITEPSAVLGSLCDDELQAAYDHVLEQFALEILIGADKNSEWSDGKLVIAANHGPIHLLQAAFYAVKLEVQRRNAFVVGC